MGTTMTAPVEQTKPEPKGIRGLLMHDPVREKIAPMLPPDVEYERVVAAAGLAARQNPDLLKCTPASLVDSVVRILQWGLEIGVTAHLVPFNVNVGTKQQPKWEKHAQPVADYKGLAELMIASGAVRHVEARVVHARDHFEYEYGLNARLEHRPATGDRGAITAAYVVLRLPFGRDAFEVMTVDEIEAIRNQYSKQWKTGVLPSWYAKKTVVRQASKLVPKNPRLRKALAVIQEDELAEFGDHLVPVPDEADAITPATPQPQITAGAAPLSHATYADESWAEATPEVREAAINALASLDNPYDAEPAPELTDAEIAAWDAEQELPLADARPSKRKDAIRDGGR